MDAYESLMYCPKVKMVDCKCVRKSSLRHCTELRSVGRWIFKFMSTLECSTVFEIYRIGCCSLVIEKMADYRQHT